MSGGDVTWDWAEMADPGDESTTLKDTDGNAICYYWKRGEYDGDESKLEWVKPTSGVIAEFSSTPPQKKEDTPPDASDAKDTDSPAAGSSKDSGGAPMTDSPPASSSSRAPPTGPGYRLRLLSNPSAGSNIPKLVVFDKPGKTWKFGRRAGSGTDNDIALTSHKDPYQISRTHASIEHRYSDADRSHRFFVVDLKSKNGLFINDRRQESVELKVGDRVTFGGSRRVTLGAVMEQPDSEFQFVFEQLDSKSGFSSPKANSGTASSSSDGRAPRALRRVSSASSATSRERSRSQSQTPRGGGALPHTPSSGPPPPANSAGVGAGASGGGPPAAPVHRRPPIQIHPDRLRQMGRLPPSPSQRPAGREPPRDAYGRAPPPHRPGHANSPVHGHHAGRGTPGSPTPTSRWGHNTPPDRYGRGGGPPAHGHHPPPRGPPPPHRHYDRYGPINRGRGGSGGFGPPSPGRGPPHGHAPPPHNAPPPHGQPLHPHPQQHPPHPHAAPPHHHPHHPQQPPQQPPVVVIPNGQLIPVPAPASAAAPAPVVDFHPDAASVGTAAYKPPTATAPSEQPATTVTGNKRPRPEADSDDDMSISSGDSHPRTPVAEHVAQPPPHHHLHYHHKHGVTVVHQPPPQPGVTHVHHQPPPQPGATHVHHPPPHQPHHAAAHPHLAVPTAASHHAPAPVSSPSNSFNGLPEYEPVGGSGSSSSHKRKHPEPSPPGSSSHHHSSSSHHRHHHKHPRPQVPAKPHVPSADRPHRNESSKKRPKHGESAAGGSGVDKKKRPIPKVKCAICGKLEADSAFKKCASEGHFFCLACIKARFAKAADGTTRCPVEPCKFKTKGAEKDLTQIVHNNVVKQIVVEWARVAVKSEESKMDLEHCEQRESIKRLTHKVAGHYEVWTDYQIHVLQNDKAKIMGMAHSYMKKFLKNRMNPTKATLKGMSDADRALVEKAKAERAARLKAKEGKAGAGAKAKMATKARK